MTFRIATLLYVFALLAAGLSVWGPAAGLIISAGTLLLWLGLTLRLNGCAFAFAALMCLLIGFFIHPAQQAREAARRNTCLGHLKWISLAILNYEASNKTLPPAVTSLGTSGDTQSWRVVLLPFMESQPLYNKYNMNEPWDGPNNRTLASPGEFLICPTHGVKEFASYQAVVGPECTWNDGLPRKLEDITDGPAQTILLIDVGQSDIDWKEPRDLTFDEAVKLLTSPVNPETFKGHYSQQSFFREQSYSYNVAMVDGHVRQIRAPLDHETAIALLTANGGETIDEDLLDQLGTPKLRYDRIYGLVVFVTIALLPAVPVVRRHVLPKSGSGEEKAPA